MSSASRFRVVATILLLVGAGLVMAVLATGDTMRLGMVIPLVILTTLRAADMFAGRTFQPKEQDDRWQLGEAIFVVAALTLDPAGVVLVAVLGPAIGLAASRLQPAKIASNLGVELISVASGLWVLRLLGGVSGRIDSAELAAAGLAALAFFAVGLVVVASGLAWVNGRPVRESLSVTKFVFVQLSCSIAIGLLAAASSEISPFAPVLAIPPVAMVQMVLGEHFRARVARTRIDGLFQTAVEAHASVLSVEVAGRGARRYRPLVDRQSPRVRRTARGRRHQAARGDRCDRVRGTGERAARRGDPPAGHSRPGQWPRQPRAVRRPRRAGCDRGLAQPRAVRGRDARSRLVQEGQRQPRARDGQPAAAGDGRAADGDRPRGRHGGPPRQRPLHPLAPRRRDGADRRGHDRPPARGRA